MNTTIKNGELVNKSTQLHKEVKEMVERNTERLFLPHNEKLKKLFVEDLITSLREWEEKDYSNDYHLFSEFCYDLVGMIEQGRTLNMYDEYGNRFEFIGHLIKPDWRGGLREVCIDYVIPEMGLEWLKKSNEFFQERVEYWEQFNPIEQGLCEVGFSVPINYEEHWFIDDLQFVYERLVESIYQKLNN